MKHKEIETHDILKNKIDSPLVYAILLTIIFLAYFSASNIKEVKEFLFTSLAEPHILYEGLSWTLPTHQQVREYIITNPDCTNLLGIELYIDGDQILQKEFNDTGLRFLIEPEPTADVNGVCTNKLFIISKEPRQLHPQELTLHPPNSPYAFLSEKAMLP